jgi:preprotein translocase subunit SecG
MLYGIWGGIAIVAGILAVIGLGLYYTIGLVGMLSVTFFVVCALMILVILAQKPRGGGLAGAFGGAGGASTQTAFGAKTGDVMTWTTIVLFVLFIGTAMGLTWATRPAVLVEEDSRIQNTLPENTTGSETAGAAETSSAPAQVPASTDVSVPAETPAAPTAPATTESQP